MLMISEERNLKTPEWRVHEVYTERIVKATDKGNV